MADLVIDTTKIEAKTKDLVAQAERLTVTTEQELEIVGGFVKGLAELRKDIASTFDPISKIQFAAHKETVKQKKRRLGPVEEAEQIVKRKAGAYLAEKERRRLKEEADLREVARKQEEERRQETALALEKAGKNKEAEALVEAPVVAPAIVIPQTTTKVEGISKLRKVWKFRVTDASKVPDQYKKVDEVRLGQVVRATKGTMEIAGVEIYSEDTVSAR